MNQAAQTAKRSPAFAASYQTLAKKRGRHIATIAIARKLLAGGRTCPREGCQRGAGRRPARTGRPCAGSGPLRRRGASRPR